MSIGLKDSDTRTLPREWKFEWMDFFFSFFAIFRYLK